MTKLWRHDSKASARTPYFHFIGYSIILSFKTQALLANEKLPPLEPATGSGTTTTSTNTNGTAAAGTATTPASGTSSTSGPR